MIRHRRSYLLLWLMAASALHITCSALRAAPSSFDRPIVLLKGGDLWFCNFSQIPITHKLTCFGNIGYMVPSVHGIAITMKENTKGAGDIYVFMHSRTLCIGTGGFAPHPQWLGSALLDGRDPYEKNYSDGGLWLLTQKTPPRRVIAANPQDDFVVGQDLRISPNGKYVLYGYGVSGSEIIRIANTQTWNCQNVLFFGEIGLTGGINFCWLDNESFLVGIDREYFDPPQTRAALIWSMDTITHKFSPWLVKPGMSIDSIVASDSNQCFAVEYGSTNHISNTAQIAIFDAHAHLARTIKHPASTTVLRLSNDGRYALVAISEMIMGENHNNGYVIDTVTGARRCFATDITDATWCDGCPVQ